MEGIGVATEGGVVHISTGAYYLLPRYLRVWCHSPNGRVRGNGLPGPPGYMVPAGVGRCGDCKETGRSPGAVLVSGDPLVLAAVEAWVVAVLPGPADGAEDARQTAWLSAGLAGGFCEDGHGGLADELGVAGRAVTILGYGHGESGPVGCAVADGQGQEGDGVRVLFDAA